MNSDAVPPSRHLPDSFTTTRWSMVLACGDKVTEDDAAHAALSQLCQNYWRPVLAFICRRGYSMTDAQDLTQDFFVSLLEGNLLHRADPERGRFRNLLLRAVNYFLSDAKDRQQARKRGGHLRFVSWDEWTAEAPSRLSISEDALASWPEERVFDVRWAATVVERAIRQLAEECEQHGRRRVFDAMSGLLMAERAEVCIPTLARQLGAPESTEKRVLHEMRERYRALLRAEVADTLTPAESIEEEVRYLCAILAAHPGASDSHLMPPPPVIPSP